MKQHRTKPESQPKSETRVGISGGAAFEAVTSYPLQRKEATDEGTIQRMSVGEVKSDKPKYLKASDKFGAYVLMDVGDGWHISFNPSGNGAEGYVDAILQESMTIDWRRPDPQSRQYPGVRQWMIDDLPFDMFHVTSPLGHHFFFSEAGELLGENLGSQSKKYGKGAKGAKIPITDEERMQAMIYSQIVVPRQYNWATSRQAYAEDRLGLQDSSAVEAWRGPVPQARYDKKKDTMEFTMEDEQGDT